jgi:hypothetical protein
VGKMLIGPRLLVLDAVTSGSMMPDGESSGSPGSVIHQVPRRGCSQKVISKILHSQPSQGHEDGFSKSLGAWWPGSINKLWGG